MVNNTAKMTSNFCKGATRRPPPVAPCQKHKRSETDEDLGTICTLSSCDVCPEYAELDDLISEAYVQLSVLLERRQTMKKKLNDRHDLLTNRLPPELICRIFILSTQKCSCSAIPYLLLVSYLEASAKHAEVLRMELRNSGRQFTSIPGGILWSWVLRRNGFIDPVLGHCILSCTVKNNIPSIFGPSHPTYNLFSLSSGYIPPAGRRFISKGPCRST